MGVSDAYVIQDGSALKWGVSLGVFKPWKQRNTHVANHEKASKTLGTAPRLVRPAAKMLDRLI